MVDEQTLKSLAEKALTETPPYDNAQFPPSMYYRFFKELAAYMKPSLSVELGVCGGGGSLYLALGYPEGQVVGVDITYDHPRNIETIIQTCPNFIFWHGDSIEAAPQIYEAFGPVSILFIDTLHTEEQTWAEFNAWKPFFADDIVICLDDLFRRPMGNVWEELPGNKLRIDRLHDGAEAGDGGFGVIWNL